MQELTGIERIDNILHRKPVDRIGLFEHFWGDTRREWSRHGHDQHIRPEYTGRIGVLADR